MPSRDEVERITIKPIPLPFLSVHRARRCCVCKLCDGICDAAPDRCAVIVAFGREFVTPSAK
jgi:hypothetical protein